MELEKHTYEYDVALDSNNAPARVIRMAGHGRRILEVGAGPGSITRHLIGTNNCDVVALEIDPSAIAKLKEFCQKIYSLDLNDATWPQSLSHEDKFDVVIAADVLEHVYDPLRTLKEMKSLLREGGEIILSLPHVGHCAINACLLDEDFTYRDWGLLDKTHIRFFGIKNINRLYADAGMGIVEAQFVILTPGQTEFADRWDRLPAKTQRALLANPFGCVYQVVTKAKALDHAERNIDLMTIPPAFGPKEMVVGSLRETARKYLSPEMKMQLLAMGRKFGVFDKRS